MVDLGWSQTCASGYHRGTWPARLPSRAGVLRLLKVLSPPAIFVDFAGLLFHEKAREYTVEAMDIAQRSLGPRGSRIRATGTRTGSTTVGRSDCCGADLHA